MEIFFLKPVSFLFLPHIISSLSPSNNKYIYHQTPKSKTQTERSTARGRGLPPDTSPALTSTHSQEQLISRQVLNFQALMPESLPKGTDWYGSEETLKPTQVLFWVKLQSPSLGSPKLLCHHNSVLGTMGNSNHALDPQYLPIKWKEYFLSHAGSFGRISICKIKPRYPILPVPVPPITTILSVSAQQSTPNFYIIFF